MLHGIFIHLLNVLLCCLSQEAILDIKRIRVSYLRTWFIPDVIAAFPIGYILLFAVIMNRLLKQQTVQATANSMLQYSSVYKRIMHVIVHYLFIIRIFWSSWSINAVLQKINVKEKAIK